ncbi:MAG: hypothetical protein LBK55_05675, partial [Azoarcus sp.]|nr:hypothetical protein [Azoarcus sp.]
RGDACVGLAAPKRTPKRETSIDCWDNAVAESFFATLKREVNLLPETGRQDACGQGVKRFSALSIPCPQGIVMTL